MSQSSLRVGFGEADVTPPLGALMCGSLAPRTNVGTDDPLLAKALVAESGGNRLAVVGVDLIGLPRELADGVIDEVVAQTGLDRDAILISCSHTHSGPYTGPLYTAGATDDAYLASLPTRIAGSVQRAVASLQPATMHVGRSLVYHGLHHRRVTLKDGLALNTWMRDALDDLDVCPQVVGTAGPIDPELWVLRFEDAAGKTVGAFVNFSLHVNSHFGTRWSADYPGVIAEYMRREFGPSVTTVFTPGACANVNPTLGGARWREGAEAFAESAVAAARRARRIEGAVAVGALRRDVLVPKRDPESQPARAAERLNWGGGRTWTELFEETRARVAALPDEMPIPVSAARLGPVGIASNPGELFVEWGLEIKRRSRFRHTVVAQLTNDLVNYQPTVAAFQQGGYETLVGPNRLSPEGIEQLVDTAVALLGELSVNGGGGSH